MQTRDYLVNFLGAKEEFENLKGRIVFLDSTTPVRFNNQLITLFASSDMLPEWAKGEARRIFIHEIHASLPSGRPLLEGVNSSGERIVLIQREEDGRIIFNFNPQEAIAYIVEESYLKKVRPFYTWLPHYIPSKIPLRFRKFIKWGVQRLNKSESSFPDWPIEVTVELIRAIFVKCLEMQGAKISKLRSNFLPQPKKFTVVLTHDVDTSKGFKSIDGIAKLEEKRGFVSTWFLVAHGYNKDESTLKRLIDKGHEIAMHGDYHDSGLSFSKKEEIMARFKKCSDFIDRYQIKGFRAPSLLYSKDLMRVISEFGFYDSSVPDTGKLSPFPKTVGCCTVFPYIKDNVLEIPISVPLDSSLIFLKFSPNDILEIWKKKMEWVRQIGGVFVLDTHPEPHFIADSRYLESYRLFLEELAGQHDAWITTAANLAEWWKARIYN